MFLLNCSSENVKQSENQIKLEVRQSFDELVTASKSLDIQRYFKSLDSQKFVGLSSNGTNWNSIDDLKNIIQIGFSSIDRVESLEFPNVKISVIDSNTAILVNEYEQSMLLKDGSRLQIAGGGTQVWSKASGSWKLVSISASNKN